MISPKKLTYHLILIKLFPFTLLLFYSFNLNAQNTSLNLEQAIDLAIKNNMGLMVSSYKIEESEQMVGSAININKTQVYYNFDQNNIAPNNLPLNVWGINQSFEFPTVYGAKRNVMKGRAILAKDQYSLDQLSLTKEVSKSYYEIIYRQKVKQNYRYLDSLYKKFTIAVAKKFDAGNTNYLEKLTAESKHREITLQLRKSDEEVKKAYIQLNQWLQTDSSFVISDTVLVQLPLKAPNISNHPGVKYYLDAQELSRKSISLEKQKLLPDLEVALFRGTNRGAYPTTYSGFQAGIALPIWFCSQKSKIDASKTQALILVTEAENYRFMLQSKYQSLLSDLKQHEEQIEYYNNTGEELSKELVSYAKKAYKSGKIDFLDYVDLLYNAKNIETNHLTTLLEYNLTALEIMYLTR